jgi:hypothetical protein
MVLLMPRDNPRYYGQAASITESGRYELSSLWRAPVIAQRLVFDMEKHPSMHVPWSYAPSVLKPANIPAETGAPGRIRTSDPQIRSLVLYPAELRALVTTREGSPQKSPAVGDSYRLCSGLARLHSVRLNADVSTPARTPSPMRVRVRCAVREAGSGDLGFSGGTSPRWFRLPA